MSNLKKGDVIAFTHYCTVNELVGKSSIEVTDLDKGIVMKVGGEDLLNNCAKADHFEKTTKVTKTAMAEKLITCFNTPFTVCFDKASGQERILRGRMITPEPVLGRSKVEDLDIDVNGKSPTTRQRQVDHRTLKWLIVDGVKHVLKK